MKNFLVIALIFISETFVSCTYVKAANIDKGKMSFAGFSNLYFRSREADTRDSKTFSLDIKGSYFVINNLDVGVVLYLSRKDINYLDSNLSYNIAENGVGPNITYHFSLNDTSSIYVGAGILFGKYNKKYDAGKLYKENRFEVRTEFGWEYFFNPHIAMNIGLIIKKIRWNLTGYKVSDDTETSYSSGVGLKVFL